MEDRMLRRCLRVMSAARVVGAVFVFEEAGGSAEETARQDRRAVAAAWARPSGLRGAGLR